MLKYLSIISLLVLLGFAAWALTYQSNQKQEEETPAYTADEVATHNTADNCWMSINGGVYDVTSYLPNHPSKPGLLEKFCGKDGTQGFTARGKDKEDHSAEAYVLLEQYKVGVLK